MKAACALVFLGLTWTFDDDEFLARSVHPAFLRHRNKDIKIDESLLDTPKKFLDFDVTNAPKILNADDNEFFSTQRIDEDDVALAVKLLLLIKESQPLDIFADDSDYIEDHIFAQNKIIIKPKTNKDDKSIVTVTDPVKDQEKPKKPGEGFVKDVMDIVKTVILH